MNAWRAFSFSCEMVTYSMEMFLDEPLFYNPFLKNSFNERVLIQRFTDGGPFRVKDLKTTAVKEWPRATALAERTGVKSGFQTLEELSHGFFKECSLLTAALDLRPIQLLRPKPGLFPLNP